MTFGSAALLGLLLAVPLQDRKDPKEARLRLVVETASRELLPAQPLVANLSLFNDGLEDVPLRTMLSPYSGYLKASVRRPGSEDWSSVPSWWIVQRTSIPRANAPVLGAGRRWTWQTDLALDLGLALDGSVLPGAYGVRLELLILDRAPVAADDLTVQVSAPTGADDEVFREIEASKLHEFVGPAAVSKWRLPAEAQRDALTKVEELCRRFPDSRYAPDLRAGFVRAALVRVDLPPATPEARIDLDRRLKLMAEEMMRRDELKSWARAEMLLYAADVAVRVRGDFPFTRDELRARFRALCPDDQRRF